jgi:hypothetical protein
MTSEEAGLFVPVLCPGQIDGRRLAVRVAADLFLASAVALFYQVSAFTAADTGNIS